MIDSFLPDSHLTLAGWLFVALLLAGTLCMLLVGKWLGARRLAKCPDGIHLNTGILDSAVFGLMALLIGFTFSNAATRFDTRRMMVVEEANCIGTAWLRLDLLPLETQPPMRELFRQYLESRLSVYRKLPDIEEVNAELLKTSRLQSEMWRKAIDACEDSESPYSTMLVVPSLNAMIDIATARNQVAQMHPPLIIYAILVVLVLASSVLAGHGMGIEKAHSWFHATIFIVVIASAVYVIFDFEHPRIGLIRLNSIDQVLVELQKSMQP